MEKSSVNILQNISFYFPWKKKTKSYEFEMTMRLRVIISLNVWTKIKSDILKTFQFPKLTNTTHLWEHENTTSFT